MSENLEDELIEAILEFDEEEVLDIVDKMKNQNIDKLYIAEVCRKAMDEIGRMFENKEIFLTELIMSGEILKLIMKELGLDASSGGSDGNYKGVILLGTVEGDVHDIGKNIVASLLSANSYRVIDIGVDVPASKFIEEIKRIKPDILGLSGLLTLAYDSMKNTIEAIMKEGLRDKIKIMIGGGAIDEQVREYTKADAFGSNAMDAVKLADKWLS
ncbi:MAG: cobalamin B12-binding domain-containing protein [Promethearchaeota archaeon]